MDIINDANSMNIFYIVVGSVASFIVIITIALTVGTYYVERSDNRLIELQSKQRIYFRKRKYKARRGSVSICCYYSKSRIAVLFCLVINFPETLNIRKEYFEC